MSGGPAPGILRLRNGLEVWPNEEGTAAGFVDVRNASGTANIVLKGDNGRIGIGTTNPDKPLTIQGTGGNSEWLSLKNSSGATKWHLNHFNGGLNFTETDVADNRLFLGAGGNVGIGTASPGATLLVRKLNADSGIRTASSRWRRSLQGSEAPARYSRFTTNPVFSLDL